MIKVDANSGGDGIESDRDGMDRNKGLCKYIVL